MMSQNAQNQPKLPGMAFLEWLSHDGWSAGAKCLHGQLDPPTKPDSVFMHVSRQIWMPCPGAQHLGPNCLESLKFNDSPLLESLS